MLRNVLALGRAPKLAGIVLRQGFIYVACVVRRRFGSRRRIGAVATLTLAIATSVSGTSSAQPAPERRIEPFRLVWSSSAGCRGGRTFLTELESRTTLLREAQADEHAITFIVETFRTATGVRGQLTVRKPDGDLTVREVPGVSCQEVESAMALIAALMVDPLAEGTTRVSPRPPDTHSPSTGPVVEAAPGSLRVEQRLTGHTAIAPALAVGQAWGFMLTREASWLHPSIGLSAQVAKSTIRAAQGSAELAWLAAQLTACPLGAEPGDGWDFRACATLQLGRLRGSGFQTTDPATKSILWSAAGAELQARYRLVGPLWLGLEGGFTFPFTRERFYLEPRQTLHQVPAWGASGGGGLGLRFL